MIFGGWKKPVFFQIVFLLAGLLLFPGKGFGADLGLSPLPWGVSLEDLNRLYQEQVNPQGELKPDLQRFEIDLQIQPRQSVKIPKGDLVALVETPKGAGPPVWADCLAISGRESSSAGSSYLKTIRP